MQVRHGVFCHPKCAVHVCLDGAVELLGGDVGDGHLRVHDGCIVDEDVETSQTLYRLAHGALAVGFDSDVVRL